MNPLPKSHESLRIISQSLANPYESPRILSQSLANPHKSPRILSQSLVNPHESSPKVSQILANPFLIISNTPYLVNCIEPTNLDINTELIFIVMGMNTGTICLELLLRIHKDSCRESEIVTINVIFGPQPQSDHIAVYINSNENIQNYQLEMFSLGGGVNYQTQIVTKLPNENIQNYQLEMIDSWGWGGKLPNANCDRTTKWKITKHTSHK